MMKNVAENDKIHTTVTVTGIENKKINVKSWEKSGKQNRINKKILLTF